MHEDLVDAAPHSFKYVPRSMPSEAGSALLQGVLLFGRGSTPHASAHNTKRKLVVVRLANSLAGKLLAKPPQQGIRAQTSSSVNTGGASLRAPSNIAKGNPCTRAALRTSTARKGYPILGRRCVASRKNRRPRAWSVSRSPTSGPSWMRVHVGGNDWPPGSDDRDRRIGAGTPAAIGRRESKQVSDDGS
jgi:hypothetical protein